MDTKPILVEVRTKLPLDCYVKLSAYVAERNMKRGKLFENALNEYWDMETYCLDKGEYAEYEKLLATRENLHPCTLERMEELKKRIAAYEHEHNIHYGE